MIFVPLLHYFACKNIYSGNEEAMRYRITPGKRALPGPDGAEQEQSCLTVDIWPEPWTLERTDPALRRSRVFPLSEEGRAAAAAYLAESFEAEAARWRQHPSLLDSEPWSPPPAPDPANAAEQS